MLGTSGGPVFDEIGPLFASLWGLFVPSFRNGASSPMVQGIRSDILARVEGCAEAILIVKGTFMPDESFEDRMKNSFARASEQRSALKMLREQQTILARDIREAEKKLGEVDPWWGLRQEDGSIAPAGGYCDCRICEDGGNCSSCIVV